MLSRLRSLMHALRARSDFESGMTEEIRFHIEHYAADLIRSGLSSEEAHRRARLELGGVNTIQENCRQARGLQPFDEISRSLRYAARLLRKAPAFTVTALATLALCLGANLTIFSVIDAILVRPLPFPEADRLVTIFNTYPKAGVERDGASITNYYERRGALPAFSSLSIYRFGSAIVGKPGAAEHNLVTEVSPDFFRTLAVEPVLGRSFRDAETTYQTNRVVILTQEYRRLHFNTGAQVIGQSVWIDGTPHTVIGVLPSGFRFLSSPARLYLPFASAPDQRGPGARHSGGNVTQMVARLQPGATLAQAQSQLDAQNAVLERTDPQARMMADAGFRSLIVSLHADQVAAVRPILLLLEAGVLALLTIGIVNLVNLLLVRASSRIKEIAVRRALGASATRIAAEAVVETLLLASAGAVLSLGVAAAGVRLIAALGADRLPLGFSIAFNMRTGLAAGAAAIVLTAALAAPLAWFLLRPQLLEALQSESRSGTAGGAAQRLRHAFIVAQIALTFVLLAASGLLGLSLKRAMDVSPGFRPDHTITGQLSLASHHFSSPAASLSVLDRLVGELQKRPGVIAAGLATNIPFSGKNPKSAALAADHILRPGESARGYFAYGVAGNYFPAMGFSLLAGRFLTSDDSHRGARACVVDDDFARHNWPGLNALGRHVFQGSEPGRPADAFTVVGVVRSIKQTGLTDDTAQGAVYYPFRYQTNDPVFVVVRQNAALAPARAGLLETARRVDPALPVNEIISMDDRISDSLLDRRSPALLCGIFSGMALLLITVGTYGVLSYAVAQRRREIGVRMTLGARPQQIQQHFLALAVRLLVVGVSLGLLGAWLAGRGIQTVLFHVTAYHWGVLAATTVVIAVVALAACLVPALRAARISPMQALADQ